MWAHLLATANSSPSSASGARRDPWDRRRRRRRRGLWCRRWWGPSQVRTRLTPSRWLCHGKRPVGRSLSRRRRAGGRRPPRHGSLAEVPVAGTRQTAGGGRDGRPRRRPPAATSARRARGRLVAVRGLLVLAPASRAGRRRRARPSSGMPRSARRPVDALPSGCTPSHTAPRPSTSASIRMFSVAAEQSCSHICGHLPCGVAAHEDRDRRLGQHRGVGVELGDRGQLRAVTDHDELPRLLVAGRRRRHGRAQQPLHVLVVDRLGGVLADAAPAEDRVVHGHLTAGTACAGRVSGGRPGDKTAAARAPPPKRERAGGSRSGRPPRLARPPPRAAPARPRRRDVARGYSRPVTVMESPAAGVRRRASPRAGRRCPSSSEQPASVDPRASRPACRPSPRCSTGLGPARSRCSRW